MDRNMAVIVAAIIVAAAILVGALLLRQPEDPQASEAACERAGGSWVHEVRALQPGEIPWDPYPGGFPVPHGYTYDREDFECLGMSE